MSKRFFIDKDTGKISILIDGKAVPVSPLSLYRHALERLRERYGESQANLENIHFMEREIHERRARKVGNGYNNCSLWEVNWQGGSYFALYDDDTQTIVTFYDSPMVAQRFQFGHEEEPVTNGKSFTVGDQTGDEYLKSHGVQVAEPKTGDKADEVPHRSLEQQEFIDLTKSCRTMAELAEKSGMSQQKVRYRCKSYGVYPKGFVPRPQRGVRKPTGGPSMPTEGGFRLALPGQVQALSLDDQIAGTEKEVQAAKDSLDEAQNKLESLLEKRATENRAKAEEIRQRIARDMEALRAMGMDVPSALATCDQAAQSVAA